MDVVDRLDPERTWLATLAAALLALVGGSIALPDLVYDRFVWHYFWGPVYADANGAICAVKTGTSTRLLGSSAACRDATGIVAYIGYTPVSEVGYALVLLFSLGGVVFLLRRLDVGRSPALFFGLLPFVFFGGALRVVEDAIDAARFAEVAVPISYPWNALLISPVIYLTVFLVTLAALVVSLRLARRGIVDRYDRALFGIGTAVLAVTLGYLLWLAVATEYVGFHPQIAAVVLIGATLVTGGVWFALERYAPVVNRGTESVGAVVLWAHAVDGVANVVGIDWESELTGGAVPDLVPKHPINRAMIDVGEAFPDAVTAVIGTAWPFLLLKIAAAVLVVYIFDEPIFEESPRYAVLLLVAVVAVGLGPGTRDMIRATLGI